MDVDGCLMTWIVIAKNKNMKSRAMLFLLVGAIIVVGLGVLWEVLSGSAPATPSAAEGKGGGYAVNPSTSDQNHAMHLGRVEVVSTTTPADATYTTRGRIEGTPEATLRPGGVIYLQLHHEAIPEFVGSKGEVEGMNEMIMDFPTISANVSWAGLGLGDPVELTFEVRWNSNPRFILTNLTRLPDDATLNLSRVQRGP
ncbi:MAG: hypothetical protein SGI86_19920 [Deltaproteobacteria bacterium]|nr:hypothetical protein [Deltaproteobacteria bacterium]